MEQSTSSLAADIEQLTILLKVTMALLILLIFIGGALCIGFLQSHKSAVIAAKSNIFNKDAQKYLEDQDFKSLEELSLERVSKVPGDELGFYYLGRAQFGLNKLSEAKANFLKAKEIGPGIRDIVNDCLRSVEEELENSKPRSVT